MAGGGVHARPVPPYAWRLIEGARTRGHLVDGNLDTDRICGQERPTLLYEVGSLAAVKLIHGLAFGD